jgi:TatD DNase family protein
MYRQDDKMIRYIDTHAHYDDERFDADRSQVIGGLLDHEVALIIDPATDLNSSRRVLELSTKYPNFYCAVGVHPHQAAEASECDIEALSVLCEPSSPGADKIVAIGETGLDYHYDFSPRDVQLANFRRNIRLALKHKLPLIVHDREAHQDTLTVLREENGFDTRVLYHCYSGSAEYAKELTELGCFFSFGGAVTFKNAKKFEDIVLAIPIDRILPETDSPYMAPEPVRGTRNDSSNLKYIYPVLARLMGLSIEEAAAVFADNTARFFGIREFD